MFSLCKADLAVYGFYGYDHSPPYIVNQLGRHPLIGLNIIPQSVTNTYPHITLFGADIERSVGPFVLRAEAAYQHGGAFYSVDWQNNLLLLQKYPTGVVEKKQVQYVVGLDKNDLFIRNLFLNFQCFGEHILDHDDDMVSPKSRTGVTAYLRYAFFDSRASLSYRMMALFKGGEQRHHVEASYKPKSWAEVSLGGIWYEGNSAVGEFGQYDNHDFIYAKLKLVF